MHSADAWPAYSIVVPVYNNERSLARVVERLRQVQKTLGVDVEGVFVVDGSPDSSASVLNVLLQQGGIRSQLIVLSRNYGALAAVRAGLDASRGAVVAIMAADLQEPEELYIDFYRACSGDAYVAIGRRETRADPGFQSLLARMYWAVFRRLVVREIPPGGVDVFAARRQVVDELVRLPEAHSSIVGLLYLVGFPRHEILYHRAARDEGRSSWSLRKRLRYLFDSIFAFTDLPIIAITTVGFVGSVGSIAVATVVFVGWLLGKIAVPGYTPLILAVTVMTSLMLFSLGVIGSYVWRTYEHSKQRPRWIPMSHRTYSGDGEPAATNARAPRVDA